MRIGWLITIVLLLSARGLAQEPSRAPATLRAETTLVEVPATIRSGGGNLIQGLTADDFRLLDDDVEQRPRLRENLHEPIAVVVLMQTGGDAPRQFENYPSLATMLDYALGSAPYRVSLVTFDSKPEDHPDLTGIFDLLTPLRRAAATMQQGVVATLTNLSGGTTLPFGDQKDLEAQMINFANELGSHYLLEFQLGSNKPGLHHLQLEVPGHPELHIAARNSYWRTPSASTPEK